MPKKIHVEILQSGKLEALSTKDKTILITVNTGIKAGEYYRVPVKASKIFGYTIPGAGIVEKFATHHQVIGGKFSKDWCLSHVETGRSVGYGKTQQAAIEDGIKRLDYHSRRLVEVLNHNRKQLAAGKQVAIPAEGWMS